MTRSRPGDACSRSAVTNRLRAAGTRAPATQHPGCAVRRLVLPNWCSSGVGCKSDAGNVIWRQLFQRLVRHPLYAAIRRIGQDWTKWPTWLGASKRLSRWPVASAARAVKSRSKLSTTSSPSFRALGRLPIPCDWADSDSDDRSQKWRGPAMQLSNESSPRLIDCGAASRRTRGLLSGVFLELAPPPYNRYFLAD